MVNWLERCYRYNVLFSMWPDCFTYLFWSLCFWQKGSGPSLDVLTCFLRTSGGESSVTASSMAKWQQIQMLEQAYLDQVHSLYANDCLPMEVRQYLGFWIEEQNW